MTTRKELRVTRDSNGNPTLAPTLKVYAGIVAMIILIVIIAMLAAITPEMLTAFGPWASVIFAGIVALGGALSSYIKRP